MSRKSGKKSLIGQRVAALIGNGYFAPATIISTKFYGSEDTYLVKFDDNTSSECTAKDMIGTNFGSLSDVYLQRFQKVYTTHNGREVSGYIQRYQDDQILISIPDKTEGKEIISKKPDEVRLLDSRRSQRLQGSNPMDYKKMSEEGSSCKRNISASIEVPQHGSRMRRTSEEPTMTELMAAMVLSSMSSSPVIHNPDGLKEATPRSFDSSGTGSWTHDSKHTSPCRQPASQTSPQSSSYTSDSAHDGFRSTKFSEQESLPRSSTPDDVLDADSGMILLQRLTPTPKSNEDLLKNTDAVNEPQDLRIPKPQREQVVSPRPPSHSSSELGRLEVVMEQEDQQSIPIPTTVPLVLPARPLQVPISYYIPSGILHQPFPSSLPTEFRVHMVGSHPVPSTVLGSSAPGHIDNKMHRHLHRTAPYKINDDSAVTSSPGGGSPSKSTYGSAPASYYHFRNTPIPVATLSFSPSHHGKHARSPLASKVQSSPVTKSVTKPRHPTDSDRAYSTSLPAQPITIPVSQPYSWQSGSTTNFAPQSIVPQRQQLHQAASPKATFQMSPKSLPIGRKVRGDGKKCRKVYGMENRDLWCTACKWKKACQRFPD